MVIFHSFLLVYQRAPFSFLQLECVPWILNNVRLPFQPSLILIGTKTLMCQEGRTNPGKPAATTHQIMDETEV